MNRGFLVAGAALTLLLSACGDKTAGEDPLRIRVVSFPNGKSVRAETMVQSQDLMRGMMFRDSLAPDRGMLFFHPKAGKYKYFMYQVRIPLDIVWLDRSRQIVEMEANAPPCPSTTASQCPLYGGNFDSSYVLELGGGMAAKYNLRVGDTLTF